MLKQDLKNLRYLEKEIKRLEERIEELESAVQKLTSKNDGMPRGGSLDLMKEELIDQKTVLEHKRWELVLLKAETERTLNELNDSLLRLILSKRYIDGKSWAAVAIEIGGGNTEESVKMMEYRFFKKIDNW